MKEDWVGIALPALSGDPTGLLGDPNQEIIGVISKLLANGEDVRIVTSPTARADFSPTVPPEVGSDEWADERLGEVMSIPLFPEIPEDQILSWCQKHLGSNLPVTASNAWKNLYCLCPCATGGLAVAMWGSIT